MKTPKIANAMQYLDDDLLSAADVTPSKKRKSPWLRWGSLAACIALLVVAVLTLPRGDGDVPTGDETQLEKYYDYVINGGVFADYIGSYVIEADKIGVKIEDVTVTAGWKNGAGQWISTEPLRAEIYEITGVGRNVRVALRFLDQGEAITTTHYYQLFHPNAEYNGMRLPDYRAENPVRYLEESTMGGGNGWQDFGVGGEVRTVTVPLGSSYLYQMYSYYIRNDLRHLYADTPLPASLDELPLWLCDTQAKGRRSFWYSMGNRLPSAIALRGVTQITAENGQMQFLAAEYALTVEGGTGQRQEDWIVYFMEQDGVYSAFAVCVNENLPLVRSYTESIVKSYKEK